MAIDRANSCPSQEVLTALCRGGLAEVAAGDLERHLHWCSLCRVRVDQIRADGAGDLLQEPTTQEEDELGESDSGSEVDSSTSQDQSPVRGATPSPVAAQGSPSASSDRGGTREGRRANLPGLTNWNIPDYEPVMLCGEGAYGSVWAVRDRVGVYRALKIIDMERVRRGGASSRERTALEVYCRKVSRHPYLITIFHIGVVGPYLYYTMELADDQTMQGSARDHLPPSYRPLGLDSIIKAQRLNVDVAMELARRLLRGMAKLHSLDLVHRDIKPSNIMFVNRHPKLADIGVMTSAAHSGRAIGTPRYMPPDKVMDRTADIFAFGKVLHEMIAGRDARTFPSLPEDCLWGSMRWDLQRISEVIVRACADHAADRYPSASAMLEDLEASTKLPFDSLFEEVKSSPPKDRPPSSGEVALELGYVFLRTLPWILGFIAVIYAIARVT